MVLIFNTGIYMYILFIYTLYIYVKIIYLYILYMYIYTCMYIDINQDQYVSLPYMFDVFLVNV